MIVIEVARPQPHIDYAREPAAISGRKSTAIEIDPIHQVAVDGRSVTTQVLGAEERHSVEQDQVLVIVAASHVDGACTVAAALHAWQALQHLEHVDLTQQGGQSGDLRRRD